MATKVYFLLLCMVLLQLVAAQESLLALRKCVTKIKGNTDEIKHLATLKSELPANQNMITIPLMKPHYVGAAVNGVKIIACGDLDFPVLRAKYVYPNLHLVREGVETQDITLEVFVYVDGTGIDNLWFR